MTLQPDRWHPTVDEVAVLAGQCTDSEWDRLCVSQDFLNAMSQSLGEMETVATNLTGRKISATAQQEQQEKDIL